MQDSVTFEVQFPYWTAFRASLQNSFRSPLLIAISSIFPIMGLVLIYLWVITHHSITLYNIILLFVCFTFTPLITAINLYLARRRNPLSVGPFTYVFNASGIHASGAAFESTIRWTALQKIIETREFILFYFAPTTAIAMPKPQLLALGVLDTVREMTRAHFPAYKSR